MTRVSSDVIRKRAKRSTTPGEAFWYALFATVAFECALILSWRW